ncbi:MAG: histidinol phosphate phosphatase [Acidobacteria bacterium RIFCSPLOWO2_02_FULL_67_36]|nr:MAG: histidinol phosphate phosphatase [Acidobacteria bacterium RIFCSPLOWO2_02_FULL_67_36]OFW23113.1 MAG: histidinol phosphate phosphatase [Acidobacteria bacterium RIFCSPLOWO2_12_FULL_66_21]
MIRPTQAVILAGGRGVRLRPLTDHRPKPMIEFHGRPFLEYVIELLRSQGFRRVLLLLGYMPEVIQKYFGDGSRWGLEISYAITDAEDDTGWRIKQAASLLDPVFMLLYCDNYWPMRFEPLWNHFVSKNVPALVTVYRNRDRYTRDNLIVDADEYVTAYDKGRTMPGLGGVDIGFFILRREVLDLLPAQNVSFEGTVYPQLVARRQLCAYLTDHRYYSVGSHERLPLTHQFLRRDPAILLDRDGVLNQKPPRAEYVRSWDDWVWLPGAKEALRLFKDAGYRVILVSNQAGIARGVMTEAALAEVHEHMKAEARAAGGDIDAVFHCPHGWNEGCECRKPKPGMLFQAQHAFQLDLTRTWFIGDDERDSEAARAAGCPSILVDETRSLLDVTREMLHAAPATVSALK